MIAKIITDMQDMSGPCELCDVNEGVISCGQCEKQVLCYQCDIKVHSIQVLHDRVSFATGYEIPLSPLEELNEDHEIVGAGMIYVYHYGF